MIVPMENGGGIRRDETGREFNARAQRMLAQAKSLSQDISGSYAELNRWMGIAKSNGMTWMGGLYFSVECMTKRQGPSYDS